MRTQSRLKCKAFDRETRAVLIEHECSLGVVGHTIKWTGNDSRTILGRMDIEGDIPVCEIINGCEYVPE